MNKIVLKNFRKIPKKKSTHSRAVSCPWATRNGKHSSTKRFGLSTKRATRWHFAADLSEPFDLLSHLSCCCCCCCRRNRSSLSSWSKSGKKLESNQTKKKKKPSLSFPLCLCFFLLLLKLKWKEKQIHLECKRIKREKKTTYMHKLDL